MIHKISRGFLSTLILSAVISNVQCVLYKDLYSNCQEIADNSDSTKFDGYYYVKLNSGIAVQVYCYNFELMFGSFVKTFLNLPAGRSSNYAEFYRYVGKSSISIPIWQ